MSIDGWIALVAAGVFFLLLLSAVFSGSETALTAASRALMHQLERQGSHRAGLANRLIRQQERLIGAILLGNNLVNILASALATSVLIALFGEGGVVYATLGMTALVVVFAEVLPKTLALKRPEQVALAVSPVIRLVVAVLGPVTMVVQLVVDRLLRLFGLNEPHDMSVTGADELRGTLALQASEGRVVKAEKDMLDSILDLSDIEVGEIMVHRSDMVAIDADLPSREIVDAMLASSYTRVPLWRGNEDNIVGVLHARDLLHALGAPDASAGDIDIAGLLRPPWFVPETRPVGEQLNAFRARRQHFALVVDEYGAVMGLVTLEDILEEIVGDIEDEHDRRMAPGIRRDAAGGWRVDGAVTIRDLNRELGLELPEDDAATIAGLVIAEAQRIPDPGESFVIAHFRFEVLRRAGARISQLRIQPASGRSRNFSD